MKGACIVFTLCVMAVLNPVHSDESIEISEINSSERERTIEELINNFLKDPLNGYNYTVYPGNGVLRVKQSIYNMVATGLSNAVKTVKADLKAGTISLAFETKRLTVHVDYDLDGYCLILPIWGKGKGVVVMDDVKVTVKATVVTLRDKIKITGMKITFDISDGSFALSSLFGESEPGFLTPLYVKAFNANSRYIFNEILPAYIPHSQELLTTLWGQFLQRV